MNYEEALKELKYDNEERDWDNCMFDMAGGVYEKCKEALEKQIPKKPIAYGKRWNGITVYKCPVCNSPLGTKSFNEEQNQVGCARCLSAIDWSEVE